MSGRRAARARGAGAWALAAVAAVVALVALAPAGPLGGAEAWAAEGAAPALAPAATGAPRAGFDVPPPAGDTGAPHEEGLTAERFFFLVFAAAAAVFAVAVVLLRNPLSGALSLVMCLFAVAALYAMMGAHFIAAIQVIIYAGAVMVLFVFVIMLLNLSDRELGQTRGRLVKGLGVILFAVLAWWVWTDVRDIPGAGLSAPPRAAPAEFGSVKDVGRTLFSDWLFPFELTGLLLLVAVVGAVAVSRRGARPRTEHEAYAAAAASAAAATAATAASAAAAAPTAHAAAPAAAAAGTTEHH